MEANISCNGSKGVVNSIMGSYALVVMSTMQKVDTHRVNGMCAHTSKDICNLGMGQSKLYLKHCGKDW